MSEVEIPVYLQTQIDDVRVGVAKVVGVCDCSANYCCCSPADQKQTIQITIENNGFAKNVIENAKLGFFTGLYLACMVKPAVKGNTSEQE